MKDAPIALVTGVGPGTGAAVVRRFVAGGYRVAMLARDPQRLAELATELPGAHAYGCDVADTAAVDAVLARIRTELGPPAVLVHNAVAGGRGHFMDMDPALLEAVPIAAGHSAFVMPIVGKMMVDGQNFDHNELKLPVFPPQDTSHAISLRSLHGSAKVMLFAGPPLSSAAN